ncbi:hypothetical protein, partial [Adlercreutzia equolifaciens]|uniref:hypothetical protein n=1 Tax=Adlercreutzia equolifaciens TaxID=446660 RepID=UPI00266C521E
PFRVYRKWVYVNGGLTAGAAVNASSTPKWPTLRFRKGPQFGHFALQLAFLLMVEGHFALQLAFR